MDIVWHVSSQNIGSYGDFNKKMIARQAMEGRKPFFGCFFCLNYRKYNQESCMRVMRRDVAGAFQRPGDNTAISSKRGP